MIHSKPQSPPAPEIRLAVISNALATSPLDDISLASELGVARETVIAHRAVLSARLNKACKEAGLALEPIDALGLIEYVTRIQSSGETFSEDVSKCFSVTPEQARALHSIFLRNNRMPGTGDKSVPRADPDAQPIQAADKGQTIPFAQLEVRGDSVDYDFPVKAVWREKAKQFIAKCTCPEERSRMKVLCLPGAKVGLEVEMYLDLGFKPENITGVEGGRAAARAEFQKNAARYGIRPLVGRLENILPGLDETFDLVFYDFLGALSHGAVEIVGKTQISDRALVLVNLMGARESAVVQRDLANRIETGRAGMSFPRAVSSSSELVRKVQEQLQQGIDRRYPQRDDGNPLAASRDSEGDLALIHSFGHDSKRFLESRTGYLRRHGVDREDLHLLHSQLADEQRVQITSLIARKISRSPTQELILSSNLALLSKCFVSATSLASLERYSYKSEASSNHTPYYSSFAQLIPFIDLKELSGARYGRFLASLFSLQADMCRACDLTVRIGTYDKIYGAEPALLRPKSELRLYVNEKLQGLITIKDLNELIFKLDEISGRMADSKAHMTMINGLPPRVALN